MVERGVVPARCSRLLLGDDVGFVEFLGFVGFEGFVGEGLARA